MTGEVKLLPCPFCGVGPVANDRTCYHPQNDCALDGWHFNIPNWQSRPTLVTDEVVEMPTEAMICEGGSAILRSAHLTCCERAKIVYLAMRAAALASMPTLVTGQLQEDGGDSNECPECQGRGERWVQPDGLPRAPYPAQCDYCHGTGTMATRAASETPTPGLTDDVVKELLDETPTGAFGLPRWKYLLRADAACLSCTDQTLAAEYRKHLAQRLGNLGRIIEALLARTGVILNG